jgi:hypothetical protein
MRYKGLVDWSAPNVAPTVPPAAAARELPDLSNGDTNVAEARKATMWRVGAGKAKTRGAGAAASRAKTRRAAASKCEATWVERTAGGAGSARVCRVRYVSRGREEKTGSVHVCGCWRIKWIRQGAIWCDHMRE